MRHRRFAVVLAVLVVVSVIAPAVVAQEPSGGATLAAPEEWVDLPYGQTAPLRTPPVRPLQVGLPEGFYGIVRAPDGSQVAWAQRTDAQAPTEIVVADVWGGGRRVVYRTQARVFRSTALTFSRDSTAVLFVAGDALLRVDVVTGAVKTVAVDDRFTLPSEHSGTVWTVSLSALRTGDLVVERWCNSELCGHESNPLLWRSDTGDVQDLPYGAVVTHDGRRIVMVDHVGGDPVLQIAPVRRPANRQNLATLSSNPLVRPGAIRHDDEVVALTGFPRGHIEVRSLDDGSLVASASPPADATFADTGGWSPDGSRLLTTAVWQDPFERQPWVFNLSTGEAVPVAGRERLLLAHGWTAGGSPLVLNDDGMWRVREGGGLAKVTRVSPANDTQPRRPVVGPVGRYAGVDRIATAVALSRAAYTSADAVVVARADLYPDALAGSALAGKVGGPVLLTSSSSLDPRVASELDRLGASTAYVLGTHNAISRQVVDDLRAAGMERVIRLGGPDRFDTAALVAGEVANPAPHAFIVEGADPDSGRGWPDAVAIAGRAAATATPVLLAVTDRLPDATRRAIADLGVERVTIVGGPVAVSAEVEQELRSLGVAVDRVAGDTRFATSVAVAEAEADPSLLFVVTGSNWPDALAAGPAAAHVGGTVLLTPSESITASDAVESYVNAHADPVSRAAVVGSTAVVAQRIVRELAAIINR